MLTALLVALEPALATCRPESAVKLPSQTCSCCVIRPHVLWSHSLWGLFIVMLLGPWWPLSRQTTADVGESPAGDGPETR